MSGHAKTTYPEHEKLAKIRDQSQGVGEFLTAMRGRGLSLCEFIEGGNNGQPRYLDKNGKPTDEGNGFSETNPNHQRWSDGWHPIQTSVADLLANFFEIDLKALEQEKRKMLAIARGENS